MTNLAELTGDENSGEGSRTFIIENEGHTLGNALKTIISRYTDVDFCGYTIPHPIENKVHFRIQSRSARAVDILKRGFDDLSSLCNHMLDVFDKEVKAFETGRHETDSDALVPEEMEREEEQPTCSKKVKRPH